MKKTLLVLAGPTASGKTALAIELAKTFNTVIISADSRQFFKEISIGTAKPNNEELAAIKHYFIHSHSIHTPYNVGQYEIEVMPLLTTLFQQHDVVILCGGSGLYIRAIVEGLDQFPTISQAVQEKLKEDFQLDGLSHLQKELSNKDPNYYQVVDIENPHRVLRALAVIRETGLPFSSFLNKKKTKRDFNCIKIGLEWPREQLYNRINERVLQMMEQGLLEEAKSVYPYREISSLQTVGYVELFDFMEGKTDLKTAIQLIQQHSRNYAKRQLTWFKKDAEMKWFHPNALAEIKQHIYLQLEPSITSTNE
jgi:tRNA dimethylallyltransferase